jgi:ankyrin repeat protein
MLLNSGANVTAVNNDGEMPFHQATSAGNLEITNLILQRLTPLEKSTAVRQPTILLRNTPLHEAAIEGHFAIVRRIVEAGADLDQTKLY